MIRSDALAAAIRRVVRFALPWLLLVAVLGNVAITIEFHSGRSHAIQLSDGGDLADLIDSTYPEMRHEYGVYAELRRLAFGSTLELPDGHPFDLDRLQFVAGMTQVEGTWYPPAAAADLRPSVSSQMWIGVGLIDYQIVAGRDGEPYGVVRGGDGIVVAPTRLLGDMRGDQ